MLLKTLVKVSTVNNLSDARYCAGMGVAMMGAALDTRHPHYMTPEQFKAITQWIQGVALVGELDTADPAIIRHTLAQYALDYLQLTYPVALSSIVDLAIPVMLKLNLQGNEHPTALYTLMATYLPYVKYFLLEAASTHSSTTKRLQATINHLANNFPILQGWHVTTKSLPHLLNTNLQGIALQGGIEKKPGYKDFDSLSKVLEYLTIE
ncbi:MAG: beta/alpha barrel domain-containing protein [Bacteroidota bacterium]